MRVIKLIKTHECLNVIGRASQTFYKGRVVNIK